MGIEQIRNEAKSQHEEAVKSEYDSKYPFSFLFFLSLILLSFATSEAERYFLLLFAHKIALWWQMKTPSALKEFPSFVYILSWLSTDSRCLYFFWIGHPKTQKIKIKRKQETKLLQSSFLSFSFSFEQTNKRPQFPPLFFNGENSPFRTETLPQTHVVQTHSLSFMSFTERVLFVCFSFLKVQIL
jgi:hypothetical protein